MCHAAQRVTVLIIFWCISCTTKPKAEILDGAKEATYPDYQSTCDCRSNLYEKKTSKDEL